jgi:anti-sigma regulatory factor (Ser/Thr protein kinase)/GNAT superfamily N-acetyltransferase
MESGCDYSKLTIPSDASYVAVACGYVSQVAERIGFSDEERALIRNAVGEAVRNVIEHAFEPSDLASFEISCERVPLGLKIVIRDQGLPFDPTPFVAEETCRVQGEADLSGLCLMRQYMDQVEFHNLGPSGKEIVLVKYAQNRPIQDYFAACELEQYQTLSPIDIGGGVHPPITFEPMRPDQAVEVCKTLYKAYGYSYFYPHMYYPDRIVSLNESGHLFSMVALTDSGEVAGHAALIKTRRDARIAELGIGAVKPAYRSRGVLTGLGETLIKEARAEGLLGIFAQAVTNHTFSQRSCLQMGFKDSAVLLAYVPMTSSFKRITDILSQRDSMVVQFLYLDKPARNTVYLPGHHRDMLVRIYNDLGINSELVTPVCALKGVPAEDAVVRTVATNVMGMAKIQVEQYGHNVLDEVKTRLKDLRFKQFEIIYLYLDLSDPLTCLFTGRFEELGFFFAGVLPGAAKGDALILQYLNNVALDYGKIRLESESGRELLEYIRKHDPNR